MSSARTYPFKLEVLIYTRPNLRDDNLEMEMYFGRAQLESMFDKMEINEGINTLFLSFPERWLNIIEQRQLLDRIAKYFPNMKDVQIKTHSVFIIQTTPNDCAHIVDKTLPDDGNIANKQYNDPIFGNLFDMSKINVIGGNVENGSY